MDMAKKLGLSVLIIGGIVVCILLMLAMQPLTITSANTAANVASVGNYYGFEAAVQSYPLWQYGIPVLVGGIAIVMILRAPER